MIYKKLFKACYLESLNKHLKISRIVFNNKLSKGQVLVKLKYSGICGSQIGEITGIKGKDKYLPHLLGHEGSGVVKDVGPGVKYIKRNQRVILHWMKSRGVESASPIYLIKNKIINAGKVTTFNEYAIISENRLTNIPKGLSFKNAVVFGCAITTGYGSVYNDAKIKKNKNILVLGSGGVGLSLVQSCQLKKSKEIVVVDLYSSKLKFSRKFGSTKTILYKKNLKNLRYKLNKVLKKNEEFDYCFDTTGDSKLIELAYSLMGTNSKLVLIGVPHFKTKVSINTLGINLGKKIIGSKGGNINPYIDIKKIYRKFKNNKISFSKFYEKTYKIDQINEVIKKMKTGKILGRPLIKF